MLRATVLIEDSPVERDGLVSEHGLSLLLETSGKRILFDCGHTGAFLSNARTLGIEPIKPDAVVLSHGHYDHAGGYSAFLSAGFKAPLYTGPGFFEEKFSRDGDTLRPTGAGYTETLLTQHGIRHTCVSGVLEMLPGVWLVGDFNRNTDFETIPGRFLRREGEQLLQDDFCDEICMAIDCPQGLLVVVGCAHPGIVNMLRTVSERLHRPIYGVLGGAHLANVTHSRLRKTQKALEEMGICVYGFGHCTGKDLPRFLSRNPQTNILDLTAGQQITL